MKKNRFLISMALVCCTMLTACGSSKYSAASEAMMEPAKYSDDYDYGDYAVAEEAYEYDEYEEYEESAVTNDAQAEQVDESANSKRKLIRTIRLNAETYDFGTLTAQVAAKVNSLGGYIESSDVYGDEKKANRSASYTLRIPAANADEFVGIIEGKSNITSRSENVEDVTLSYVDIQSRKESLQIEYDRLQEMLGNAETVEDMIYIEDRLSNVRYEIQSIESQLRVYDNKIDYTTIYLEIDEVKEYTEPEPVDNSVGERIKRGLSNAGSDILEFIQDLIVGIVVAIPYLLVLAILFAIPIVIIVLIVKACRKRSAAKRKNMVTYAPYTPVNGAQMNATQGTNAVMANGAGNAAQVDTAATEENAEAENDTEEAQTEDTESSEE